MLDPLFSLLLAFGILLLLLLQLELHLDSEFGLAFLSLSLSILIILLGLDLSPELGHLGLQSLTCGFLGGLLLSLFLFHLEAELFHLGGGSGLLLSSLTLASLLFLSVLNLGALAHCVLISDRILGSVPKLDLSVASLAPVKEHSTIAENDAIIGLQSDWSRASEAVSIDTALFCSIFTVRDQLRLVTIRHEVSVLCLDTNATKTDLRIVLRVGSLSADLGISVR